MEEDKGPVARVSPAHSTIPPPAEPSSSSNPPQRERAAAAAAAEEEEEGEGLRFEVELRPGETTIVSWKKLLKEAGYGGGPPQLPGADPVLAAQPGPSGSVKPDEDDLTEKEPPTNRYSAVIEKIERLYMGKHSSDEEDLDDAPVDDQYDTEDSFIDDAELDEYFQVDKLVTKHNGYFVNKGKLEQISEPSSSPVVAPRKRRRKDSTHHEDHDHVPSEHVRIRRKRMNTVSRSELYMRKNLPSYGEEDGKLIDNKQSAPIAVYKKKSVDLASSIENPTYAKLQNKDVGALQSRDISEKSRGTNESYHRMYSDHPDKGVSCFLDFQSRKLLNGENEGAEAKFQYKEKSTSGEFAERNISGSSYPLQVVSTTKRVREGAAIRPKGTRLERAIRDLEKIVAEIRPPSFDVQGADSAHQGVKRRLPPEVKQRLAKVARLTASKGKFSEDELIDRLMSIVGHLVHRKTLKRNMRELVELGLSAKQQKADRFEQIKREVYEMIKARISTMKSKGTEQQDGSTDDFQEAVGNEERRALKGRHSMDATLEDKICDLYDLYVEGMDEDKGPLSRKLYVELAELWPHGYMDNVGIKDAIYRSKERKGALYRQHKVRDEERLKRRRLAAAAKLANSAQTGQTRALQERQLINYTGQGIVSPEKTNTSNQPPTSTSKATTNPALPPVDQGSKYEGGNRNADASKKPKRNPEHELGEAQALSLKLPPQQHSKERQKSQKNTDEPNTSVQPKANIQMSGLPNPDQPS